MRFKQLFYCVVGIVFVVIGVVSILIDPTAPGVNVDFDYTLNGIFYLLAAGIIIYEALRGGSQ